MKKPAGSLEPINTDKGKWTDGLGALEINTLSALATDINKAIDQTVKQVARGKIRVGKLLLEARAQFQGDQAFGQWRKSNTMIQSKQHAHYLMKIAERFGDAPKLIDGANYSVMQELVLADQADIQWIEDKIDAGEPLPTVQEVRKKVKQTQAERLAPKGTSKKGMPIKAGIPQSPNMELNRIVQMALVHRIKLVVEQGIKGIEGDYIILGLDPDPQCPCNEEVLDALEAYWDIEEGARASEEQYSILMRSMERVREEFKNWG